MPLNFIQQFGPNGRPIDVVPHRTHDEGMRRTRFVRADGVVVEYYEDAERAPQRQSRMDIYDQPLPTVIYLNPLLVEIPSNGSRDNFRAMSRGISVELYHEFVRAANAGIHATKHAAIASWSVHLNVGSVDKFPVILLKYDIEYVFNGSLTSVAAFELFETCYSFLEEIKQSVETASKVMQATPCAEPEITKISAPEFSRKTAVMQSAMCIELRPEYRGD